MSSLKDTELWLCERCRLFFNLERVHPDDDFLSLGGHSLMAIRLITEIHEAYSVILSIDEVFDGRSLSSLSSLIVDRQSSNKTQSFEVIHKADRSIPLPLSPTQEYLLFESLLNADKPVYNEVCTIRFGRYIEHGPLEQAFNTIISRHEAFRMSFEWESGELYQLLHSVDAVEIPVEDFRSFPEEERDAKAEAFANEWSGVLFDLKKPPLIRAFLGIHSEQDKRLHIVAHHLAIDAYTLFEIIPNELWTVYTACIEGKEPNLPCLDIQSPDVASWRKQRAINKGPTSLPYWKQKMFGFRPLELPGDKDRGNIASAEGTRKVFSLTPELTHDVKSCALHADVTPFVVLLAAFKALLFNLTREEDITIGSVTGGRDQPQMQTVAGCFLHFVALRTQLSRQMPVSELMEQVAETVIGAVNHQEIPLLDIRDSLDDHDIPKRSSNYKVMFLMEPPIGHLPGDWTVNQLEFHPGTAKLDLTFEMDERNGCYFGRVEYRNSLYTDAFIEQLIDNYRSLLATMVGNPDTVLEKLATTSKPEDPFELSDEFRTTYLSSPEIRLHDPMEEIARQYPGRIALEFGRERVTYGELKRYSDNIALQLQQTGVGTGQIVAVIARRSHWLMAALFGVLKSGAAYLPIDPDQPDNRVRYLLEDSSAKVALTDPGVVLPADLDVLGHDIQEAARSDKTGALVESIEPKDLAYVIYTSGSTGNPKGSMIQHRSIVNRLQWMVHEFQFTEKDVQIQKTPITFDVSLHELFLWSYIGARLVIPSPGSERDPAELIRLIQSHRVTQVHFVPSMMEVFLAYLKAFSKTASLATLRHVYCSGEALPSKTVKEFQELIGRPFKVQLHNLYGPTEAAVEVSCFNCTNFDGGTSVPIGKPIWNTRLYVLDAKGQPVDGGNQGELFIGGIQVARGYINHPELTSAAFIPDPFSSDPDALLYKTGDQARWLPDGNLEYLGRNDFQIKVRGVRIEPAEIENAIRELPNITGSVCVARKSENGEVQLVAYFTSSTRADELLKDTIMQHIRKSLPPQMIPNVLMQLDSFPLNQSGKLNRKELPDPYQLEFVSAADLSSDEVVLAGVWESVLQISGIGSDSDFFELGGDSILAIKVISRIRQRGYLITLRDFFEESGLRSMAASMQPLEAELEQPQVSLNQAKVIPIQSWFLGLNLTRPSHWNQSRLIVLKDKVPPAILEMALHKVIKNHQSLRLHFQKEENGWIQKVNSGCVLPKLQVIDAESLAEEDIFSHCANAQASLDIGKGILLQALLFEKKSSSTYRFFLCIHHLVIDAISWQIILEDLETACLALANNLQPHLQPEVTSPLEWAEFLGRHAQDSSFKEESEYWRSFQIGESQLITPANAVGGNRVEQVIEFSADLNQKETDQLLHEVPSKYNTEINDILLTALGLLLKNTSGQDKVAFFLEGHGREWIDGVRDLSRTTGWFTTLFPVKLRMDFPDMASQVKSVKEQLREIPGRGIGFGLKECFESSENTGTPFKPELVFNYLGNMDRQLADLSLIESEKSLWQSELYPGDERPWIHELLAWIKNGKLTVGWYTSKEIFSIEGMQQLVQDYISNLRKIIQHCVEDSTGGYTPSDFKSAGLNQDELDDLFSDFEDKNLGGT